MLKSRRNALVLLVLILACGLSNAANPPDERQLTDPKSIVSAGNPRAAAVPIHDLYYTRTVFSPSWSPGGREIVLTTNLTGRLNLWKVSAAGGWPIQLSQSDDRQSSAVWSPDGKWAIYEQVSVGLKNASGSQADE